ncbi:MAG: glutamate synthase-related protein [Meiothermus sp.]|uniref:glutamate synthase-related protein n=1 Tax=Meiothermus sp. TaxID=1955249 RepID=UPI0025D50E8B|nr:glutamate synthase-related protein [Meiothermus sp.]MCS7058194.1 glutamate synthase-related protein [Meiothermus sp.]MCS7194428.1 glutamate synthase-related protein [Meiothermus sp.]MCX7739454.1 glutamate synthase-related protein [Meiothermus sp.]MDW8091092.1 glutamate synthase-related protein [Meiothermus sp.]MDW8481373.1 glutamate synthase-related protein [Meiothermus sp.]
MRFSEAYPGIPSGRDACGIIAIVEKSARPSHANVQRTLESLYKMAHRAGLIRGEGDGTGIQTDLPRELWATYLYEAGLDSNLAQNPRFFVGHLFVPKSEGGRVQELFDLFRVEGSKRGIRLLLERRGETNSSVLGPVGKRTEPLFYQVAGLSTDGDAPLWELGLLLEERFPVHVVSLSTATVVYKVRGSAEILKRYYPELSRAEYKSALTLGHNRYSTNTLSTFEQVQPFGLLGHNGEINTIERLRREGRFLGIPLTGGSDSQDLNRILEGLLYRFGLSLPEAMDAVFPPILGEIKNYSPALQDLYMNLRQRFGPLAQGPAALVTRHRDEAVFGTDAMGLRPLWFVETESEYVFSSERGVFTVEEFVSEPRPFAPGEKMYLRLTPEGARLYPFDRHQRQVLERILTKTQALEGHRVHLLGPRYETPPPLAGGVEAQVEEKPAPPSLGLERAYGWDRWDGGYLEALVESGNEPIGSLGYDGPLAALNPEKPNLSEFLKETVAVVTNPAIDREREIEHFSTRSILGRRPTPDGRGGGRVEELVIPILLEETAPTIPAVAQGQGTLTYEEALRRFHHTVLLSQFTVEEGLVAGLKRLQEAAVEAVRNGAELLVISDRGAFEGGVWLDVYLALAAIGQALEETRDEEGISLRRRTSLVVHSGAVRNLHDLAVCLGLGADAVAPWLMQQKAQATKGLLGLQNLIEGLKKGLEKVISTMGIHEVRGYGRIFSAIGLKPELAEVLGVRNFLGSDRAGYGFLELERTALERLNLLHAEKVPPAKDFRFNSRIFKAALEVATGQSPYAHFQEKVRSLEHESPVAARQLLSVRFPEKSPVQPEEVDLSVGGHSLPFVITAMSFGSQGEASFRAYVEAAKKLNMVCINGEGGEIPDMLGKYTYWRGQQVASGRFGAHAYMLNSASFIEIKIGQGAKPGEGGHLPGKKVTAKVAAARNAVPGVDLISPSNNHDLYSIEDLAQLIEELKTVNPKAKVSVKVPVIPGIGTIAVGIAKAGADVIALSGFEGGTGAARWHALKYAGLPVEIGVRRAHRALVRAGLRDKVELWADGGLKTAYDVLRMVLLGADRVGMATMAMVAIGCTICRQCQTDTCHVGIATQIETLEQAQAHGLKRFVPQELDRATEQLVTFFKAKGEELRRMVAALGVHSLRELVGRSDLLDQEGHTQALDLSYFFEPVKAPDWLNERAAHILRKPLNQLTRSITDVVVAAYTSGERELVFQEGPVGSTDRALGTHLAGEIARRRLYGKGWDARVELRFDAGSIAGNGIAAFNVEGLEVLVEGGAQDGVAKNAFGGKVAILKGRNPYGQYVDGSVGKSFAYGAIGGLLIVEGQADSRFCIRLSGADVVLGGEPDRPVQDELGNIAARAQAKGFAFEYMTRGRAVVLGDPGPWICSGMTGGRVYLRYWPEMGLTEEAMQRRLAKGAKVVIQKLDERGIADVRELMSAYLNTLRAAEREEKAERLLKLLADPAAHFRMVVPTNQQVAQEVSTE